MARKAWPIRFSDEERAATERRAKAADMDVSEFRRKICSGELGSKSFRTRHEIRQVGIELKKLNERYEKISDEHYSAAIGKVLDQLRYALAVCGAYSNFDIEED